MWELLAAGVGRVRFPSALVIEASPDHARFTTELMRGLGFDHVWGAVDSATAFADLHQLKPDLVILGVDVAPLDGFTLARTIRSAAEVPLNDLPILFLTPNATELQVHEVRAIRRGVLLVRPPSRESLKSHISQLLRAGRGPGPAASHGR